MLDAEAIKAKLPDIRGIETLAITIVGDRAVAAFDGRTTSTAHNANEDQMILAIRNAAALPATAEIGEPVQLDPQPLPVKGPTMSNPAPGGFAADIKAILDSAKLRVVQAQNNGRAKVNDAASRLGEAAAQVDRVTDGMAAQINDQADAVLAELGQISNMPPE